MAGCVRCGRCCLAEPCDLATEFLGSDGACSALEQEADGLYSCGLVLHPSRYLDMGQAATWKDEMLVGWFRLLLGIGIGCDSTSGECTERPRVPTAAGDRYPSSLRAS